MNIEDLNRLFLNYDLSINYLQIDGEEFKSLQKLCILTAVAHAFECNEAIEEIKNILQSQSTGTLYSIVSNKLRIQLIPFYFVNEIKLTIRLVYEEIKGFLTPIIWEDKFLFLGNFVFNWQGAINPRETVLKVLNCSTLPISRKFEISCKYLFDEQIITTYLNDLGGIDVFFSIYNNFVGLSSYLYYYWVRKIQTQLQRPPTNLQQMGTHQLISHIFFLMYTQSDCCTEIGVQYLFENIAPPTLVVNKAIVNLLTNERRCPRINIAIYLLCQMRDDAILNGCSFHILENLVKNSRWHGIFIRYFSILRYRIDVQGYIELVTTAMLKFDCCIKTEGKDGKYFIILKDFINLIPTTAKRMMMSDFPRIYVSLIFCLFVYEDIELIRTLLTFDLEIHLDFGYTFYIFANTYIDLFEQLYHHYRRQTSRNIETILRRIVSSEDQVSHLLRQCI
ncbi:UNVERIFIED_CONTAM: hypothetical protein RMT77_011791 [Armadillidium vulgare]